MYYPYSDVYLASLMNCIMCSCEFRYLYNATFEVRYRHVCVKTPLIPTNQQTDQPSPLVFYK